LIAYGRQDKFPIRRSITRVKEFLEGGVNVTTGQDDIDDPYYSFGRGDMLEVAYFMIHSGQFSLPTEIEAVYDMITHNGAKALNLDDYGLEVGKRADVVILNAHDVHEAFRMQAERTHVIKNGKLVAETRCERSVRVDVG
jgi:cytosine deaminase